MKLAFIDVETTGLDPQRHALWSLGCILEVDGEEVDRFSLKCQPHEGREVEPEALAVGKITEQELMGLPSPYAAREEFESHLRRFVDRYDRQDKFFFVAYNAPFDYQFVRSWWEECGDPYYGSWFWHPPLDVMGLAALVLIEERPLLKNFKLETVCGHLGVELTQAHDALADIEATRRLWHKLEERKYQLSKESVLIYQGKMGA